MTAQVQSLAQSTAPVRKPLLTPRRTTFVLLIAGAVLLPTMTAMAMPHWFQPDYALNLSWATSIAVGALALNLLIGYAGQISLGHGALLGVGAFAAGMATTGAGLPMWVAIPLAAVVTALVSLVIGFPALRLRGLYLAMVTIAFGYAMYTGILSLNALTGGTAGVVETRRLWGSTTFVDQSYMLAGALILLVLAWFLDANVTRSRLGRAFKAIRESEAVAASFGVDVARYKLLAFVISGALAGVAGAIWGFTFGQVNSESFFSGNTFDYSLLLILVVVIGGLGSRAGVVIAAFAFTLFPFLLSALPGIGSSLHQVMPIVGGALLMYTVARHPGGFASLAREARERRRARSPAAAEEAPVPAMPRLARTEARESARAAGDVKTVLDASHITVRFGGLTAVDDASLHVDRGTIVGLIGPNGAGKTTLFNAISGLIRPTTGTVHLMGDDVSSLPAHERARRGLARTFQQVGLSKDQTVLENMLLAQHVVAGYGVGAALASSRHAVRAEDEMAERARQAIRSLGFAGREDVPVRLLSGGQQRIVEVGCALLADPTLLMLDEPSAGMAPAVVESLADRLRELRDQLGRTVLLIEHNVPLVLDVCDYVYVLNFGRILAGGSPEYILEHPDVISAYLGEAA